MEAQSKWYQRIAGELDLYVVTLSQKDAKKYKLDLLRRIAGRVDAFSPTCGECQVLQQDITGLTQELSLLLQMPSKEGRKAYTKKISSIVEHLKKEHKLINKGHYIGIVAGIGMAFGSVLGGVLEDAVGNPGIGTAIGIALGVAIGRYLDKKAEKEGRVI